MTDSFFRDQPKEKETGNVPELKVGRGGKSSNGKMAASGHSTKDGFTAADGFTAEDGYAESGFAGSGFAGNGFSTEEGRMAAIMSYIPILCFIPLLNMRDNKEAHFHARQGVILFLIELIAVIFLIDGVSDLVFKGLLLIALGLSGAGMYFALQGRNYRLPVVSDLAEKSKRYSEPIVNDDDQKAAE